MRASNKIIILRRVQRTKMHKIQECTTKNRVTVAGAMQKLINNWAVFRRPNTRIWGRRYWVQTNACVQILGPMHYSRQLVVQSE